MQISHSINDNGTLTIFVDNMSVADISDCSTLNDIEIETLMTEVLTDLGYDI